MIELKFTEEELKIIGEALGQMPFNKVAKLISNINLQIEDSQNEGN